MTLHVDPVCGMKISEEETKSTSQYEGQKYYFCSFGCQEQFDEDPDKFIHGSKSQRSNEAA